MGRRATAALLSMVAMAGLGATADAVIISSGDVAFDFVPAPPSMPPSLTPQDVRVGRTAPGNLTVNGGSSFVMNSGAGDDPFLVIGRRAGSNGSTVLIDNGVINLNGSDSPGGTNVQIGRDGFGRMTIQNGGALNLINPDLGRDGVENGAGLTVGRDIGGGDLLVDNGTVTLNSESASFSVGREGATANATVRNGSTIAVLDNGPIDPSAGGSLTVGRSGPANASMTVIDSTIAVRSNNVARIFVGRDVATGTLRVTGPASDVTIDAPDSRLVVGRDAGSTGTATLENGANLDIAGDAPNLDIARFDGSTGSVIVQSGATVTVSGADGDARVAADLTGFGSSLDGGTGSLTVTGAGSRLSVQDTVIAGSPVSFGGTGTPTATIVVANGGKISADRMFIGRGGTLTGSAGMVTATVINDGGLVAPGFSPGTLTVDNFVQTAGTLAIEIAGLLPGQFDVLNVLGDATFSGGSIVFSFINGFLPSAGDIIPFLTAAGSLDITGTDFSVIGALPGFDFSVDALGGQLVFQAINAGIAVTEPASIWVLLTGFLTLGFLATARRLGPRAASARPERT